MGILLSSGLSLDKILEMSWDQIHFTAMCIQKHKVSMIEMVMTPIAEGLGGKSSKKSKKMTKKMQDQVNNMTPEQKVERDLHRQHRLHQQLHLAGIRVHDKPR